MKIISMLLLGLLSCSSLFCMETSKRYPLIPQPTELIPAPGNFVITTTTAVGITPYNRETKKLLNYVGNYLAASLGQIHLKNADALPEKGNITFIIDDALDLKNEGYSLIVTPEFIKIKARTKAGAFWGFQTLRQLLPAQTERKSQLASSLLPVACAIINDAPRFEYRGVLLDVSRHMFGLDFIKKYIDLLASYKLNVLHWHVTDDQGWRIEIKKYPKLQEIGAYRDQTLIGHSNDRPYTFDGKPHGGYYTQQEIKELVAYAQERFITIIPEIEMPGHCLAALAAYPELGCRGNSYATATIWGIHEDVYCAGNEKVFTFLEDILTEILNLFPSKYIHIGGDEVLKNRWKECAKCQALITSKALTNENELQSYFITRIEKFLNDKGRIVIGWEEILEGALASGTTIMSWHGIEGAHKAAHLNHNAIMTPQNYLYFDYYQSTSPYEPLAIGGYLPLQKVYEYEPVSAQLSPQQAQHILGAQANVWTEYIKDERHVEYMTCPRLMALAEITWSQTDKKNYSDFLERLENNLAHLKAMNIQYADYENSMIK